MFGLGIEEFIFLGIIASLFWLYFYSVKRLADPNKTRFRWFFGIIKYCFPFIAIYIFYKILEASTRENT